MNSFKKLFFFFFKSHYYGLDIHKPISYQYKYQTKYRDVLVKNSHGGSEEKIIGDRELLCASGDDKHN